MIHDMLISGLVYTKDMETFGSKIAEKRKEKGLTQKDLAEKIKKEDGNPISPQYLNDIEHDRRDAPSEFIIKSLSKVLDLPENYLVLLSKRFPEDMAKHLASANPHDVEQAYQAFRKKIKDQ
jgi:transcriptional regulator with XRE-family HTH domain